MADRSLYRVAHSGKTHIVRAEDRNAIKRHVLDQIKFECATASAEDVVAFHEAGGKVVEIKASAESNE